MSAREAGAARSGRGPESPARILVSACLLGRKVRYDGGHKRDPFLAGRLAGVVECVPVCPEVECGLPVPREPMRLSGDPAAPRLVTVGSGIDHTARMMRFTAARLRALAPQGVCGYVCKIGSPSCGMGSGLFTKAFAGRFPFVPVEEEWRLQDPALREAFFERAFTMKRFLDAAARGKTRGVLVAFHADHKLLLLAHGRKPYAEMGRLVARAKELPAGTLFARYRELLAGALAVPATRAKRADVLLHMAGHLKRALPAGEKRALLALIERFRLGLEPLSAPMALLRRFARRYDAPYLARQAVLEPHPARLMLLDHV